MMKLSVEKLHITSLQKAYGALEDSSTVGLVGLAKANSEFKLLCFSVRFPLNKILQVEMKVLIIVIHRTLREAWYSSAWDRTYALFRDDKNHEYDIPGAEPVSLKPLKILSKIIQKDQQPLTMSSMLNLCMVHYQKATQCLASKLRNGQDQS
ncbi:hypothetical protein Bca4012_028923 [Brassica carinata]|uniref:Uncharacterized protein n=1 Tax=Brassica carinata TaxID=52824 RepID=A0A8X7RQT9_BRACI|nr:hypothetical protein Bca52824_049623 [Brassica carinata]